MAGQKQASDKENNRADSAAAERPASKGGSLLEGIVYGVAAVVTLLWNAATSDGVLAAAGRQGIDELGAALKAFPESIQVQETGTLWNPTQGEIAADRQKSWHTGSYSSYSSTSGPPHPWPSEIARQNQNQPSKDHGDGHDHGHDAGHSM